MGQENSTDGKVDRSVAQTQLAGVPKERATPPEDRQLPPTDEPVEREALANFRCPFLDSSPEGGTCLTPCPFGHLQQPIKGQQEAPLRAIPEFFCLDALQGRCGAANLEAIGDQLIHCDGGFHPGPEELLDAGQFDDQLAAVLLGTRKPVPVATPAAICAICMKTIPSGPDGFFAYLENCTHVFCGRCIIAWRHQQTTTEYRSTLFLIDFNCPSCRAPSARILLWPQLELNLKERSTIFRMQKHGFGLFVNAKVGVTIEERPNDECTLIFNKKLFNFSHQPQPPIPRHRIAQLPKVNQTNANAKNIPNRRGKGDVAPAKTNEKAPQGETSPQPTGGTKQEGGKTN